MFKFNETTFYRRHHKELLKFIFKNQKSLHIMPVETKIENLGKDCENLLVDHVDKLIDSLDQLKSKYDLIIITDFVEQVQDINSFFHVINEKLNNGGKLLITSVNNFWYPVLDFLELLKLKNKSKKRVYTSLKKLKNILSISEYVFISYTTRQFIPFKMLGIGNVINHFSELILTKFNLGIKTYILFQKHNEIKQDLSKTIIIPAKNEEKNLRPLINRIPKFNDLEIILACGISQDKTFEVANEIKREKSDIKIQVFEQSGRGKANAVFEAVDRSNNDLIAILDADISVDPENLEDFFQIIEDGKADFVNGTRFVYRMEKGAMRFFNVLGNKTFQALVSFVIARSLTDSLCGTKVFKKSLKEKIYDWQIQNKTLDPFGDFDLLFSAAYSGQSIQEYPIHYRSRTYGKTQISRFRDGFKLLIYFLSSVKSFNTSKKT